jgi:pseudaminic acid biosynthesis-associated methylase
MTTPQEQFWKGDFGAAYTARQVRDWRTRIPFWRDILTRTGAQSILEVGCGAGLNLKAIRHVNPMAALWGCDINQAALQQASDAGFSVFEGSVFDLQDHWPTARFDLVFTCGVLIHVSGADLERAMRSIIAASRRYVLAVEYAAAQEEEIEYRGHAERLWKRPFGKLYEAQGLQLVAEGEAPAEAFDRCTAWLLQRN